MAASAQILIVEDDETLRTVLADNLEDEGYGVRTAADGASARAAIAEESPDLIVLDVMLPDDDGYTIAQDTRAAGHASAILMLTARTLEHDLVRGLDAGADDYLAKPYRLAELLARIRALLRRRARESQAPDVSKAGAGTDPVRFGEHRFDRPGRRVFGTDGTELRLTPKEFDVLALLLESPGQALSRDRILDAVWGADVVVDTRTVDNFVSSLKKKLGAKAAPWSIATVRGVGYRFEPGSD